MSTLAKLKSHGAPIAVFGVIVSGKIYSLWTCLGGNRDPWMMLRDIANTGGYGHGASC
jgi:hypothetical protein